MERITPAQNL